MKLLLQVAVFTIIFASCDFKKSTKQILESKTKLSNIIGGTVTQDGSPSQDAVAAIVLVGRNFQCTGTLIHPRVVLTAAHCAYFMPGYEREMAVYFGQGTEVIGANLSTGPRILVPQIKVKKAITFPTYEQSWSGGDNLDRFDVSDLAVLVLEEEVRNIKPVKIASDFDELREILKPGRKVRVTGFGYTVAKHDVLNGQRNSYGIKKHIDVPLLAWNYMNFDARWFEASPAEELTFVEPVEGSEDSCQGDSGGPAMVEVDGEWKLLGVVSYKDMMGDCGAPTPSYYAFAYEGLCWMKEVTGIDLDTDLHCERRAFIQEFCSDLGPEAEKIKCGANLNDIFFTTAEKRECLKRDGFSSQLECLNSKEHSVSEDTEVKDAPEEEEEE